MRGFSVVLIALLGCGCGAVVEAPPPDSDPSIGSVPALSPAAAAIGAETVPEISRDSIDREARRVTLRIRNSACDAIWLGSGFALGPHLVVTNRHVLAGAYKLEVSTWDGRSLRVSAAEVGALGDLGVVKVNGRLPQVAHFGPRARQGDSVVVVGYPEGGPLTLARGRVVDRVSGANLGIPGPVLRLTARVEHGNSGGPVLDPKGRVVAIVYAVETSTGYGLAIPNDTVRSFTRTGGFQPVPPCGSA